MSDQPGGLAAALAALQTNLPHIPKAASAQYGRYADLADITRRLLPELAKNDLIFTACPTLILLGDEPKFVLEYRLEHAPSGESRGGMYPLGTGTPQQLGSAITYARRYCLCAVTGVAPDEDDDDGQAASEVGNHATREQTLAAVREKERQARAAPPVRDRNPEPDERTNGMRAMFALYNELGFGDNKEAMLADINEILGREEDPVTSRADMNATEITTVNVALRRRRGLSP